jgi:hypothetical protein
MKESRPKAIRTKELQRISEHKFENIFCQSAGFEAAKTPLENDYGIDYQVKLIDQQGYMLSEGFVCQLKGRTQLRIKDDTVYVSEFPVKTLNYLGREPMPSYVFVYSHNNDGIYWDSVINICNRLKQGKTEKWKTQKNVTICIPKKNLLDAEQAQVIYKTTHSVCTEIIKVRPTLDFVAALKDYAKISTTLDGNNQNTFIEASQPGLEAKFKLKKEDVDRFHKSVLEGKEISTPVDGGIAEFTFRGEKIYEVTNIASLKIGPNKISDELKLVIPETEHSVGPIKLEVKIWPDKFFGATTKEALPWFFKMEVNREAKKSNFSFRFHVEFAKVADYLQYLRFMEALGRVKKLNIVSVKDPAKMVKLNAREVPSVNNWQKEFFENLLIIEKHTGLKFHIPERSNREEIELVRLYAALISKGSVMFPASAKFTTTIKGDDLRKQAPTLLSQRDRLIVDLKNEFLICGERIEFDTKYILEDAGLSVTSRKLVETVDNLDGEKMYELEYESVTGKEGYLVLKS